MSALPFFSSLSIPVLKGAATLKPWLEEGITPPRQIRMLPQALNDLSFTGSLSMKQAVSDTGSGVDGHTIFGFVVPPQTALVLDFSGSAQFQNSLSPQQADSGVYFNTYFGLLSGTHKGTSADPLIVQSHYMASLGGPTNPGGLYWSPAGSAGRGGSTGTPLFFSSYRYKNVKFFNDSLTQSAIVSPGVSLYDYVASAVLSFETVLMNYAVKRVLNYVYSTVSALIPVNGVDRLGRLVSDPPEYNAPVGGFVIS